MIENYKWLYLLFLLIFSRVIVTGSTSPGSNEQKLFAALKLTAYEKSARPVQNSSLPMVVSFGLRIGQLVKVDSKKQSLTAIVWVTQKWRNPFLIWDTSQFGGLDTVHVPPTDIWVPDTVLYNNADEGTSMAGYLTKFQTKVMVNNNGRCTWMAPATFTSSCAIDVKYWPFDSQRCSMTFGSWSYGERFLQYRSGQTDTVDDVATNLADDYLSHGEWIISKIRSSRNVRLYPCCPHFFSDVTVTIHLQRKPLYHVMHLIIPIAILGILTLVNFAIPSESGERIGYVMTILLSMSVYLLLLGAALPETSDVVPLLGIFVVLTMMTIFLSLLATIAVLKVYHRTGSPPKWLIKILTTLRCNRSSCCKKETKVRARGAEGIQAVNEDNNTTLRSILKKRAVEEEPTMNWQEVSVFLDRVFFMLFLIIPLAVYTSLGIISYEQSALLEAS